MHEYPFEVTTVRLAIIVGIVASMLLYERVQLTTGGAIVPGYFALFLPTPLFILMTLLTAYLTYFIVNRVLASRYILYGRRKYEVEILVALTLVALWLGLAHYVFRFSPLLSALVGIGFVIPALIAHDIFRQGQRKTISAVLVNTAVVGLFIYVFQSLLWISPWYEDSHVDELGVGSLAYPVDLLLPGVIVSVGVGMLVFGKLGLRTGGFVTGAYLALVLLRPPDLLFALAVAALAYLFVAGLLTRHALVFGRRRFGMTILIGAIFGWAGELGLQAFTNGRYAPWQGFNVITLVVPALLANDAQRQGLYRTLWGAGLTAVAVYSAMNLLEAARLAAWPAAF